MSGFLHQLIFGDLLDGDGNRRSDSEYDSNDNHDSENDGKDNDRDNANAGIKSETDTDGKVLLATEESEVSLSAQDDDADFAAVASLLDDLYASSSSTLSALMSTTPTISQGATTTTVTPPFFENPLLRRKRKRVKKKDEDKEVLVMKKKKDHEKCPLYQKLKRLRTERQAEWAVLRHRWKKRSLNLQDEVDIGGAMAHRARRGILPQQHHEQQLDDDDRSSAEEPELQGLWSSSLVVLKKEDGDHDDNYNNDDDTTRKGQQSPENQGDEEGKEHDPAENTRQLPPASQEDESNDENDDRGYNSEEEDKEVVRRLTALYAEEEKKELDAAALEKKKIEEAVKLVKETYHDNMEYWETGMHAPPATTIDFAYTKDRDSPDSVVFSSFPLGSLEDGPGARKRRRLLAQDKFHREEELLEQRNDTHWDETGRLAVIREYGETDQLGGNDLDEFFQLPLHHFAYANAAFLHYRQLVRMASRHIVGSAGQMGQSQHHARLLRAMWQPSDHQNYRRLGLLLTQTEEQGSNMEAFLGHRWENARARSLVVKRLGLQSQTSSQELFVSPGVVGFTMDRKQVLAESRNERRRLVKKYSTEKLPIPTFNRRSEGREASDLSTDVLTRALVRPTVGYIHIPGTRPPAPLLPLTESSILFGPSDTHVPFRHAGPVDEATYTLTLSSLLSRLAVMHDSRDMDDQDGSIRKLEEQLSLFVEHAPLEAENNIYKFTRHNDPDVEIPLVQFYRTIMAFCSYVTSGCPQTWPPNAKEGEKESPDTIKKEVEGAVLETSGWEEPASLVQHTKAEILATHEASKIVSFCEDHMAHNGLQAFPRLHITFGLASLARILPPSAADIMAKPLDDHKRRTPFDIFREMLAHLEDENMLVEDEVPQWSTADGCSVRVGELEYALHQAAEIFSSSCIHRDPVEASHHEWHLGALAASLLLCSGNRLGSKSLPFPSSFYTKRCDVVEDDFLAASQSSQDSVLKHCAVRKTLPKFEELRRSTKKALGLLIHLSKHQRGSMRGHLAISSFLEWKQVVALLAGRCCSDLRRLGDIRRIHLRYAAQWALQDRSTRALKYLEQLTRKEDVSDTRLKQLAIAVENDPDDLCHWRDLTNALGPVGVNVSRLHRAPSCDRALCKECKLLRAGFAVEHSMLESRKESGEWWGAGLVSWWYPHFLVPPIQLQRLAADDMKQLEIIGSSLNKRAEETDDTDEDGSWLNPTVSSGQEEVGGAGWLWFVDGKGDNHSGPGLNDVSDTGLPVDDDLPDFFEGFSHIETNSSNNSIVELSPDHAAAFFKLVVTCHLFGVNHSGVVETIVELARRSNIHTQNRRDCSEFQCLLKLSRLGLDVARVLQHHRETIADSGRVDPPITKPPYSEAQREAVRSGVELLGNNQWTKIARSYEILDGFSRFKVAKIYDWMVEHEGIEDKRVKGRFINKRSC